MQLSVFQIDNYGPWTVTPEPRRETDLQSLQARLYSDLADFVGAADGYVFYDRFDNMVGVTNGIDHDQFELLQERVRNRYPFTISVGVGSGERPAAALDAASAALQETGSAQDAHRTEMIAGEPAASPGPVTIAHFDVVDVTGKYTDRASTAETSLALQRATLSLAEYMLDHHDSLSYFVGGDNIITVCPDLDEQAFRAAIDAVADQTGIDLQVGVGRGQRSHEAGYSAKEALEHCRETGSRIEANRQPVHTD